MVQRNTALLTDQQRLVRNSSRDICSDLHAVYWGKKDDPDKYYHGFVDEVPAGDWLGARLPEEYGGAGIGIEEVAVLLEETVAFGGAFSVTRSVHGGIYSPVPLVKYGCEELKVDSLSEVACGETSIQAFGLPHSH